MLIELQSQKIFPEKTKHCIILHRTNALQALLVAGQAFSWEPIF
jgi:hypothetical protein